MRFFFLDRTTRRTRESGCMSFCLLSSDFFFQGFTAALNNSCEPSEPPESENGDAQQKEEGGQSSRGIPGLPIRAEGDQVEAVDEEDGSYGGHQTEPQQDKNKHGIDTDGNGGFQFPVGRGKNAAAGEHQQQGGQDGGGHVFSHHLAQAANREEDQQSEKQRARHDGAVLG